MTTVTIEQALSLATANLEAGNLPITEEICRRILAARPGDAQASALLQAAAARRTAPGDQNYRPGQKQDVEIYFNPQFVDVLETWGVGNAWLEIQLLLGSRSGKVLDLACGTGRTVDFLSHFPGLEIHGCDISDMLIAKAVERGIPADRLRVMDATKMDYPDKDFDFLYSIGSLEHFTEAGIEAVLTECRRICRGIGFHQLPVSRSGQNEGWITPYQSYWNNSEAWWRQKFDAAFDGRVAVMPSRWEDHRSRGIWFITYDQNYVV